MLYIYIKVGSQTSELDKNFEVATSKFNLERPLTSMTSKNGSTKNFENSLKSM